MDIDPDDALREMIYVIEETIDHATRFDGMSCAAIEYVEDWSQDCDLVLIRNDSLPAIRTRMLEGGIDCLDDWLTFELTPAEILFKPAPSPGGSGQTRRFLTHTLEESLVAIEANRRILNELKACLIRRTVSARPRTVSSNVDESPIAQIERHPLFHAEKQAAVDFKNRPHSWSELESNLDIKYGKTAITVYAKATDQLPFQSGKSGRPAAK